MKKTMPNRFIDTEFFKRPFVRGLEAPLKTLYTFIICDCDNAGIWSPDFEIASIYIGQKVEKKAVEAAFKNKIIELKNGQWFFPDFIEHQYPKGLQDTNPAHNKIIKRLSELSLIDKNLKVHPRPSNGSKVVVEDKVKVKEEGIVKGENKLHPLQIFIKDKFPSVSKLRDQLTFNEAEKLGGLYSKQLIADKLDAMENKKNLLKSYVSVNRTLNNWCKMQLERTPEDISDQDRQAEKLGGVKIRVKP